MYEVIQDDEGKIIGGQLSLFCFGIGDPVLARTNNSGIPTGASGNIVRIEKPEIGRSNGIFVLWNGQSVYTKMKFHELHFTLCEDLYDSVYLSDVQKGHCQ